MSLFPTSARRAKASPPWAANSTAASAQVGRRQDPWWSRVADASTPWHVRLLRAVRSWPNRFDLTAREAMVFQTPIAESADHAIASPALYGKPGELPRRYEPAEGALVVKSAQSREFRNISTHASRPALRPVGCLADLLPSHRYPLDLVEAFEAANGQRVMVRPILPLDAAKFQAFVRNLSDASRSNRFLNGLGELPAYMLKRMTQIDYRTHMALVAEVVNDGQPVIIAEARYACEPKSDSAELAAAVADDWQGHGLAKVLLRRLTRHAAAAGLRRLTGETWASNARVLHLAREAGFSIMPGAGGVLGLCRNIAPQSSLPWQAAPSLANR